MKLTRFHFFRAIRIQHLSRSYTLTPKRAGAAPVFHLQDHDNVRGTSCPDLG